MIRNYIIIAFRYLIKNKGYSFLNIGGLAIGMAVSMLIGLWVWNEVSYNKTHNNYNRVAQLWQFVTFETEKVSYNSLPIPLAEELRRNYPDFESVSLSTYTRETILANGDKKFSKTGQYVEPDFIDIMSVKIVAGSANGLKELNSILLSQSLAITLFGDESPVNKLLTLNNKETVKITAVYEDFPSNSSFNEVFFLAPWPLFVSLNPNAKNAVQEWDENSYQIFVKLTDQAQARDVSAKIKDIRMKRENPPPYKPEFFLHPMPKWHLYGDFQNGINTGGLIYFVKLFGMVGIAVLLLACINFMNLSTARSAKRAKEVGIRKTLGSVRRQLVLQFLSESFLMVALAFIISVGFVLLSLPFFNEIAGTSIRFLWLNPLFWIICLGFCLLTSLVSGSYPALYLSSFQPLKVLKGTFKAGRLAATPRKALVIFQFTVSIALVIGIITVYRQIQYAKDRPTGYSQNGLIEVIMNTPELYTHHASIKNDLLSSGAVADFSQSSGSVTDDYGGVTNVYWPGKSPEMHPLLMANRISHEYGRTIGWQVVNGRDFSAQYATDSSAVVLNQAALKLMGLKEPVGTSIRFNNKDYQIIGIVENMIKSNPFEPVAPSFFIINDGSAVNMINIRLAPQLSIREALRKVERVFARYNPSVPFDFKFVDEIYARKFSHEERIGKLSGFFAILAVFISCLGLFGLAAYVAEQRTKEIGIRKVLGATVAQLWMMLSKDFLLLVLVSCMIASPLAFYFLNDWLQNYTYRIQMGADVFILALGIAIVLTLLTVSFQAIKAALMNPVKSLRNE
ncbi:FtsX-like permease family protein [Rhodocytophaga rosea]|uniref:FtsX-like permease family protein n=2 Tax=Rhodocytophaga rosea TaxID=2704465 RepID=A0A6C0GXJ3_9BACT|nr:FtsX-like permease family protein [Rhodocytophaga rosea]